MDVAHPVETARPEETLLDVGEKLWANDWGEIPVADHGPPPRLMGIVTRRTLLGAMDREILQRDVLLTRVVRFEGESEGGEYLELPPGHRVEEIVVPAAWIGKPVDIGEVLARFGVNIVAVTRRESGVVERVPGSQFLNAGTACSSSDSAPSPSTIFEVGEADLFAIGIRPSRRESSRAFAAGFHGRAGPTVLVGSGDEARGHRARSAAT
jgi:CBS domain-containing protein